MKRKKDELKRREQIGVLRQPSRALESGSPEKRTKQADSVQRAANQGCTAGKAMKLQLVACLVTWFLPSQAPHMQKTAQSLAR